MKSDYWEQGDQIFVHMDKRYGVNAIGQTVCLGPVEVKEPVSATVGSTVKRGNSKKEVSQQGKGILYTATGKRGRPSCEIPMDTVKQFIFQGMGSKAIAKELKSRGVLVSYQTIERRLAVVK